MSIFPGQSALFRMHCLNNWLWPPQNHNNHHHNMKSHLTRATPKTSPKPTDIHSQTETILDPRMVTSTWTKFSLFLRSRIHPSVPGSLSLVRLDVGCYYNFLRIAAQPPSKTHVIWNLKLETAWEEILILGIIIFSFQIGGYLLPQVMLWWRKTTVLFLRKIQVQGQYIILVLASFYMVFFFGTI